jgi:hypothetical protein
MSKARGILQTECDAQCVVDRREIGKMPYLFGDSLLKDRREVIGHDHRICSQASAFTRGRRKRNEDPAWMPPTSKVAGYHCYGHLRKARFQIVGLNNQSRSPFESLQVTVWKPYQHDIAPFKVDHRLPCRARSNLPPTPPTSRAIRRPVPASKMESLRQFHPTEEMLPERDPRVNRRMVQPTGQHRI